MTQRQSPRLDQLESLLGVRFTDRELLAQALTHSSAKRKRAGTTGASCAESYERLEFLGDRVLGLTIAGMLYQAYPKENEGHLSKRLALLVSKPMLADVARELELGSYIMLSHSERENGGAQNDGILSDVVEALIAAVYLDQGLEKAQTFIEKHWRKRLKAELKPPQDAKTRLQEWSQGLLKVLPTYRIASQSGPSHKPDFVIEVEVEGYGAASAKGASKREGERLAAKALLDRLAQEGAPGMGNSARLAGEQS